MVFSVLAGCLFILALPAFSIWWLAFFALIPYFSALDAASGLKSRLLYTLVFSSVLAVGLEYGLFTALIRHYEKPLGVSLGFIGIFGMLPYMMTWVLFALGYHFLHRDNWLFYGIAVPSLYILMEFIKELWPFLMPWGNLAYALPPDGNLVQMADVVGVHGIAYLLVMVNAVGYFMVKDFNPDRRRARLKIDGDARQTKRFKSQKAGAMVIWATIIGFMYLYGTIRLSGLNDQLKPISNRAEGLQTIVVQGNFDLKDRWSGMGFFNRLRTYLKLSSVLPRSGRALIVWPETVLNSLAKTNNQVLADMVRALGPGRLLVTGGLRSSEDKKGIFNSAFFLSSDGTLKWYDKHILLPYAETASTGTWLGRFYRAPSQFRVGQTPNWVITPFGTYGVAICFEILYPGYIRQGVQHQADYIINIANDGWFGTSNIPLLHFRAACFRAVENRRYVIRAANSGISAIIAPTGKAIQSAGLFKRQVIHSRLAKSEATSYYTRFGDWMILWACLMVGLFIAYLCFK